VRHGFCFCYKALSSTFFFMHEDLCFSFENNRQTYIQASSLSSYVRSQLFDLNCFKLPTNFGIYMCTVCFFNCDTWFNCVVCVSTKHKNFLVCCIRSILKHILNISFKKKYSKFKRKCVLAWIS
jgi:hypothetical protein